MHGATPLACLQFLTKLLTKRVCTVQFHRQDEKEGESCFQKARALDEVLAIRLIETQAERVEKGKYDQFEKVGNSSTYIYGGK